jgi:hypothetical protein
VAQRGSDQHHVDSTPIRQLCELEAGLARHGEHCSEHRGVRCEAIPRGILRRGNLSRRDKPCKVLLVVESVATVARRAGKPSGGTTLRAGRGDIRKVVGTTLGKKPSTKPICSGICWRRAEVTARRSKEGSADVVEPALVAPFTEV